PLPLVFHRLTTPEIGFYGVAMCPSLMLRAGSLATSATMFFCPRSPLSTLHSPLFTRGDRELP
ncbi:MAG TPA: hypothetical protein VG122_25260, partial [Gemmata sp.]|nr:hypothetical protein [Gemmata sp.]